MGANAILHLFIVPILFVIAVMLLATRPASMTRYFPNGRIDLTIDASMGRVAIFYP